MRFETCSARAGPQRARARGRGGAGARGRGGACQGVGDDAAPARGEVRAARAHEARVEQPAVLRAARRRAARRRAEGRLAPEPLQQRCEARPAAARAERRGERAQPLLREGARREAPRVRGVQLWRRAPREHLARRALEARPVIPRAPLRLAAARARVLLVEDLLPAPQPRLPYPRRPRLSARARARARAGAAARGGATCSMPAAAALATRYESVWLSQFPAPGGRPRAATIGKPRSAAHCARAARKKSPAAVW